MFGINESLALVFHGRRKQVAEYISMYSQPTEEARPTIWSSSSEYQVSEYQVQEYNPSTSDYQPAEYHIPEYIAHE